MRSTFQPEPGHGWSRAAYIDAPGLEKGAGLKMGELLYRGVCVRMTRSSVLLVLMILLQVQTRLRAGPHFQREMPSAP